jgi:hypothetical protein
VFIKEIGTAGRGDVPDFGAVGQVYVGQGFCELESVGVMADLAVGESIELVESWRVVECPELEQALGMTLEGLWGT